MSDEKRRKGGVLVYLGANDGGSLESIVNDFDQVFAFEAQPANVQRLKQRFGHLRHVTITWGAVCSEHGGWTTFHLSSNNVSSSLGTFKTDWLHGRDGLRMTEEIKVPTVNLSKFCVENKVGTIDSYVSDIQGADLMVLKTMEADFLATGRIKSIQSETTKDGRQNIYSSLPSNELSAFRSLLEKHGYKLTSTGWGLLTPGKFDTVPDDWWEFDSLWTYSPTPTVPAAAAPAVTTSTAPFAQTCPFGENVRCFVINLDRRPDRLQTFAKRMALEEGGTTSRFERFSGIDGSKLLLDSPDVHLFDAATLSRAEVGIAIGHYRLWRQLLREESAKVDRYLIMEDDLEPLPGFVAKTKYAIAQADALQNDWRLLWLSSINKAYHRDGKPDLRDGKETGMPKVRSTDWDYYGGMWCYVISRAGCKLLVEWVEKKLCNRAIDNWIAHIGPHHFPTLTCEPAIAWATIYPAGADSDIQRDRTKIPHRKPDQNAHENKWKNMDGKSETPIELKPGTRSAPAVEVGVGVGVGRLAYLQLGRMGRLGNQLFQIGATMALSQRHKLEKPVFNADAPNRALFSKAFLNFAKWCETYNITDGKLVGKVKEERDFARIPPEILAAVDGTVEIQGYLQNHEYFGTNESRDLLRWTFQPTAPVIGSISKRLAHFKLNFDQVCAMHVRRGDYLEQKNLVLPTSYYRSAIEMVQKQFPGIHVLVFSDDVAFCDKEFGSRCFILKSKPSPEGGDFEDIWFMSLCRAQIIANSSFSCMAAYMNNTNNGRPFVIAPNPWFNHLPDSKNLVMPHWTTIQHQQSPPSKEGHKQTKEDQGRPLVVREVDGGAYFRGFVAELLQLARCEAKFLESPKIDTSPLADLEVVSVFGQEHLRDKINTKKRLFICGEPRDSKVVDAVDADLRFHCGKSNNSMSLPFWIPSFFERKRHTLAQFRTDGQLPKDVSSWQHSGEKWCAFLYGNEVLERNRFFDLVNTYRRVDGLGKCRRNTASPLDRHTNSETESFYDLAVQRYNGYKFVIAWENCSYDDYITEKLVNPMLCSTPKPIIIYCGAPNVGKYFNTKSFINVGDFATAEQAVEFIKKVDQDPQLLKAIAAEPYILPHQLPFSDLHRYAAALAATISTPLISSFTSSSFSSSAQSSSSSASSVISKRQRIKPTTAATKENGQTEAKGQTHVRDGKGQTVTQNAVPEEKREVVRELTAGEVGDEKKRDVGEWLVVTGLFDLPTELGTKGSNRPVDFYLKYRFVAEMDKPMVIFCDPTTYPKLWRIRKDANLLSKTLFVSMHIRDFPLWRFYDQVVENRKRPPVYDPNHRNTPAYCILTFGKFYMLRKAIQMNPFATKFVAWCDFGLEHIGDGKQANMKYINAAFAEKREKPSFCYIAYLPPSVTLDVKKMYCQPEGRCTIASSFFTGENSKMMQLCDRMDEEFVRIVSLGHGHAEEQALATVHARNPEDFHMFGGDYYEQTINYVSISQNANAMLSFFIDRAAEDKNWPWAQDACEKLATSAFVKRTIQLSEDQTIRLVERYLQCSMFTQNAQLQIEVVRMWQTEAKAKPALAAEATRRKSALAKLIPPTKEHNPPTKELIPPTKEHNPPTKEHNPPTKEHQMQQEETKKEGERKEGERKDGGGVVRRVLRRRPVPATLLDGSDKGLVVDFDAPWKYLALGTEKPYVEGEVERLSEGAWRWIDAFVFINMDSRKDREKEMTAEYDRLNVPVEKRHRFAAIQTSVPGPVSLSRAVGCTSSHVAALRMAKAKGWKTVLINEDDFNFVDDRRLVWTKLSNFHNLHGHHGNFKVAMLTSHGMRSEEPCDGVVKYARAAPNAAGYIVHHTFYDTLIQCWENAIKQLKATSRIDLYISDQAWKQLQTGNWFVFTPYLGYQRPSFSDLANAHTDHHGIQHARKLQK